jgi:membrane-bound lytic murein transglycosylase B
MSEVLSAHKTIQSFVVKVSNGETVSKLVSKTVSIAVAKPSSRGFINTLFFGSLCVATAMAAHNTTVAIAPHANVAVVHRPILTQLIVPSEVPVPTPSPAHEQGPAHEKESSMSPTRLLHRWDNIITEASQRFHVPQAWIRAVMARESGGRTMSHANRPIVSSAGAVGLMQMLPQTYHAVAAKNNLGRNPSDAHDNIMAGTAYLSSLYHKYGFPAMFAAYNAGPGKLEDHLMRGESLPAETRAYVGAIAKSLNAAGSGPEQVAFTGPDGGTLKIDPSQVVGVRAAFRGEYGNNVKSVLTLRHHRHQAILEDVATAEAAIAQPTA